MATKVRPIKKACSGDIIRIKNRKTLLALGYDISFKALLPHANKIHTIHSVYTNVADTFYFYEIYITDGRLALTDADFELIKGE